MSISTHKLREEVGPTPDATFEVARGTDTEDVEASPESVDYGLYMGGHPCAVVALHYNKYHAFLPPWQFLVSFTLVGDATATFAPAECKDIRITGDLKTVSVIGREVVLDAS